jgi:uncharacterized DUF497 family protein
METQMEIEFDWDPAKAANNLEKHNIDFEDAIAVFDDPQAFTVDVTKPEHGEDRFLRVGMMDDGRLTAIVYTYRGGKCRIISVRRARKNEQRKYSNRSTLG